MAAFLAYEMRRHRENRDLSQDEEAKQLYTTRATIQAYESQRNRPDEEFCKDLDKFHGTGEHFQALWFHAQREHLKEWLEAYLAHENEAAQIHTFQPLIIPGLFQTEDYIRANAEKTREVDEIVAKRLARREILTKENPPFLWVVIDEAAIRRPVGGPAVMRAQHQLLLDLGELPNVYIQVVPEGAGSYPGLNGGLIILTMPDGRNIGYAEAQFGGRLIEDPTEVTRLGVLFNRIRSKTL
jgi:transcriptional regulator with XRE-family HTH domain